MVTYRDEAVVLRTHKLGEADRIITLLTRLNGKVRAVAKGVRRTSSKFGARLEPFSHIDVQFYQGRNLDTVTQAITKDAFGKSLMASYPLFTTGQAMLEAVDKLVVVEREPALQQYQLLVGALRSLSAGTWDGPRPGWMILDSFLLRSLALGGYAIGLTECVMCGEQQGLNWFSAASGGMLCRKCRTSAATKVMPDVVDYLGSLLAGNWPNTRQATTSTSQLASVLIADFASWHIDRALRTLPMIDREQPAH